MASHPASVSTDRSPLEDLGHTAQDVLYVSVGLGMILFQRLQVRRQELTQAISRPADPIGGPLETAGLLLTERVKLIEERIGAALRR